MRIALAQVNLIVGNIEANTCRMLELVKEARNRHRAGLVVFPELAVTGYPPEDLLLRPGLYRQVDAALERIRSASANIDVLVGYPEKSGGQIYNSCDYYRAGARLATYRKRVLPNYGVFDEKRYFTAGTELCLLELDGISTSLSICEDLWTAEHARDSAAAGARLVININASPYHAEKLDERKTLLSKRVADTGLAFIYSNLVGGQDELIFDGGSMAIEGDGTFRLVAPEFAQGLYTVDTAVSNGAVRLSSENGISPALDRVENVYKALVLGIRDYVYKNRFRGAVIGLSGGIDSALTLCLAVDALGADEVEVLIMPSRYTADMSVEDAISLASALGVRHHVVPIEKPFSSFTKILEPVFHGMAADTTEENIQARCRGILLMAVSNKTGKLVLATGNKSEMSVGYATLYGDMAGGFAPLKDVSKTAVYRLTDWRNRSGQPVPRRIIERPPSAELRPDQKDVDSLPPYELLDAVLERYVECDQSPEQIIAAGYDEETVRHVVDMVDRNEYKRRQAAPGIKVSKRAFGRDRRYPITSQYRET